MFALCLKLGDTCCFPDQPNYKTYTKNCDKETIELLFLLLQNEDEETTSELVSGVADLGPSRNVPSKKLQKRLWK